MSSRRYRPINVVSQEAIGWGGVDYKFGEYSVDGEKEHETLLRLHYRRPGKRAMDRTPVGGISIHLLQLFDLVGNYCKEYDKPMLNEGIKILLSKL